MLLTGHTNGEINCVDQIPNVGQLSGGTYLLILMHRHSDVIECLTSHLYLLFAACSIEDEKKIIYPTSSTMYIIVTRQNPLCWLSISLPNTARRTTAER